MAAYVNLEAARLNEQRRVMQTILTEGCCPFCPEHLARFHQKEILQERDFWLVTENQWLYENVRVQLLFIAKQHVERLEELPVGAADELFSLANWAINYFQIRGGAIAMRFGEFDFSAASVKHLHAQLIEPDHGRVVRFKIGLEKSTAPSN